MPTRARSAEDKQARADAILEIARGLCEASGFAGWTMSEVALRAGCAKGTVFLYFPTKETLGVALVERQLLAWFDDVDARLTRSRAASPLDPARATRLLTASVEGREPLVALLSILGSLLEYGVDEAFAARFKRVLVARILSTGAKLEEALGFLPRGGGARLLLHLHALLVGLHVQSSPSPVMARVLEDPELAILKLDFARELAFATRALLDGLKSRS